MVSFRIRLPARQAAVVLKAIKAAKDTVDGRTPGSGPDSLHGTVLLMLLVGQQEGLLRPGSAGDEFGDVMARCGAVLESMA